ncbi:MAG: DUF1549 domain-containing protein [Rhodopirellula sp.]|nr:DUF1549 domain-containing protein [Rhodopirellula sp.]
MIALHRNFLLQITVCLLIVVFVLSLAAFPEPVLAEKSPPEAPDNSEQAKFFETRIRPLLASRCFKCHGKEKQSGGLRVDALSTLLKGGESGAALVSGKPEESLLVEAIRWESFEMPPSGKLPTEEIALLTKWIANGAFWPEHDAVLRDDTHLAAKITDEDRSWWAFQPVTNPTVPQSDTSGWSRNEVDQFIMKSLAKAGLSPAPEADRRTLIRRLYFDMIGLPPSSEDVAAFVNDESSNAWEKVIDRLLDSPQYGERWGRHWLDLVRYSESDGYRADGYRPSMWRYRDWVIQSFNTDKPFDQFVREQIAGDELDPNNPDAVVATAYWRLYLYEYNQRDVRGHWRAIIDELTDITGEAFLGMSVGCAKCHDHKFDPILREDYFRLQAFFSSIEPQDDVPLATPDQKAAFAERQSEWESETQQIRDQIDVIKAPYLARQRKSAVEKFPPDVREIAKRPSADWDAHERQLMNLVQRQIDFEYERMKLKEDDQKKVDELTKELATFDHLKPAPFPVSLTVTDAGPSPALTAIPDDRRQRDILPGILSVLNPESAEIIRPELAPESTGRRAALARWLTSPENPLSTRVIVNRIWQHHFGKGIVETSSDFGHLGEAPSHPELLDWLTSYFIENGQSFKTMHRLLLNSATYRQSATHPEAKRIALIDPANRLRWRWDIRRLAAEQIRDSVLAASGELDNKAGGPAVAASTPRRSVYTKVIRNSPDPMLKAFDVADGFNSTAERDITTTPTQSLLMINGQWMLDRSAVLAKHVDRDVAKDLSPGSSVLHLAAQTAWKLALGRTPNNAEVDSAVRYLSSQSGEATKPPAITSTLAATNSTAAQVDGDRNGPTFKSTSADGLPTEDFTIEAVIQLSSLYPDANVRTIVSQWNGDTSHRGWNLGVTSTKSGYKPRNLILQLIGGEPRQAGTDKPTYEVIASNLRPELNRPYYVAVSVDVDTVSEAGITFYMKDLSSPDAPLQTASISHGVVGDFHSELKLVIGDRDGSRRSRWDGLVDNVRVSRTRLTAEQLLINGGANSDISGFWEFDSPESPGHDKSNSENHLSITEDASASQSGIDLKALTDLCHALLNSNEFLYVD